MRALELLAPAKNLECGIAAIDHGADAVYIGASRFGARAAVGNSVDDIRKLCDYAHSFGAKVYVTVNTIIYDEELKATQQLLTDLSEAGADAILVQDMAVLQMMQGLPMAAHASTQTDNRTVEKIQWLRDVGFSRVVLARELSLDEMKEIHSQVPDIELEVFVHGALCVSYSGLCYASQYCFGRSANRGECAQFCRMQFSLEDAKGREVVRDRYLLSLKDMNRIDYLEELIEAGATSFKIEGRLKDLSYVKNVTAAYSQRLNAIVKRHPDQYCRSSRGECSYTFTPDLNRTFNRGYTTYFLHGHQGLREGERNSGMSDIASMDTPKATGAFVGTVKEIRGLSFNVAGVASFTNGDGLCFLDDNRQLIGFRANKVVGNRIFPYRMPQGLKPGVRLYRNSDQEFDRLMSKTSAERRIPISLFLRAVDGGFELSAANSANSLNYVNHGDNPNDSRCAAVTETVSKIHFPAEHLQAQRPQRENIIRQLTKLGDTIYTCSEVDIPADFNYFIPNSVLSDMRRALVEKLSSSSLESMRPSGSEPAGQERGEVRTHLKKRMSSLPPAPSRSGEKWSYLHNISNRLACDFYGASEKTAYELNGGDGPIMQCRHCIRYSLGYCVKYGGQRPQWQEPLSLVLGDGRCFRLEFDCQHCQMNVYPLHDSY
ncbi:MAG: U32 family peptidase [Prevotella sp.]|nr:U32 family peptidase [Prevotella sp.]